MTSAWWTRLVELCRKDTLSDEAVLEAFAVCLANQPDMLRFFPEDLSNWQAIVKRQAEETLPFPDQGEETEGESKGIDLEAIIARKYHCPQCGQYATHAIVSGYYDCDCGFDYGMKAKDFFEHEAERSAPDSLPAE